MIESRANLPPDQRIVLETKDGPVYVRVVSSWQDMEVVVEYPRTVRYRRERLESREKVTA